MRTGLFFGSFNPVHIGHLAIANYMIEFTDLEEIWFIVSPHNPLKEKEILLDDQFRLSMMKAALANDSRFHVSDVEFGLPRPSYTIDTLHYLRDRFPDRLFSIIMGSDGLETFHLWKDYQTLMHEFKRYIYPRKGSIPEALNTLENAEIVDAPVLEVSSTFIRKSIAQGRNMRYFLPLPVWDMIVAKRLYQ